jgi:O-acetyl-ADP-ribose deacetylase (regulator of RNase III)
VKVGYIVHARVDVIVNPANPQLQHDAGAAAAIARAAGDALTNECFDCVHAQGPLEIAEPLMTTSGKLRPHIKAVLHVVGPNANEAPFKADPILSQRKLKEAFYNCLTLVDQSPNFTAIAFPAISAGIYGMDGWSVSHAAVEAVKQFDADTQRAPGSLRQIEFIMLSLTLADTVSTVCREKLASTPIIDLEVLPTADILTDVVPPDDAVINNPTAETVTARTGEWFAIDRLLRHRRQRGKDLYLVKWMDSEIPSWIERSNITDAALQHFYANRKRRRRRCT